MATSTTRGTPANRRARKASAVTLDATATTAEPSPQARRPTIERAALAPKIHTQVRETNTRAPVTASAAVRPRWRRASEAAMFHDAAGGGDGGGAINPSATAMRAGDWWGDGIMGLWEGVVLGERSLEAEAEWGK